MNCSRPNKTQLLINVFPINIILNSLFIVNIALCICATQQPCKMLTITIYEAIVNCSNAIPCTGAALFHLPLEVQDKLHSAAFVIYK